jgi:hypothetical protein
MPNPAVMKKHRTREFSLDADQTKVTRVPEAILSMGAGAREKSTFWRLLLLQLRLIRAALFLSKNTQSLPPCDGAQEKLNGPGGRSGKFRSRFVINNLRQ